MSCYVMSRYVMLCYVMLCYVMLCYVMLCYVIPSNENQTLLHVFIEIWLSFQSATLATSPKPMSSKSGFGPVRPPVEVDRQSCGIFYVNLIFYLIRG